MNKSAIVILASALLMAGALSSYAQEDVDDQVESGEAGYKPGCSLANSMGIDACGEMPSYHSMELERQRREEAQERAQEQAEREYHNSLLRQSDPPYGIAPR